MPLMRRTRGFTLIELLVVIAIIGILAAMLFPVFARARESARKIQCLSNVKNIAMAVQMYMTDWDSFPPREQRAEILSGDYYDGDWMRASIGNPYLKWPVILDEYTKNRDIWRCPSARLTSFMTIMNYQAHGYTDWWAYEKALHDEGCDIFWANHRPYPPGWGGTVTDTYVQNLCVGETGPDSSWVSSGGALVLGINGLPENYGVKEAEIPDPARWLAVSEVGAQGDPYDIGTISYPDICQWECTTCASHSVLDEGDSSWYDCCIQYCPSIAVCRANYVSLGTDPGARRQYARHMGGVNLGFADGHAKWWPSESVINGSQNDPDRAVYAGAEFGPKPADQVTILGPLYMCALPADQH